MNRGRTGAEQGHDNNNDNKRRRVNGKPEPDSRVKEVMSFYYEKFHERFKTKPRVVPGKDASLVKGLLGDMGSDEIKNLLTEFFLIDDEWVRKRGYSLSVFCAADTINKLKISGAAKGRPKEEREHWK